MPSLAEALYMCRPGKLACVLAPSAPSLTKRMGNDLTIFDQTKTWGRFQLVRREAGMTMAEVAQQVAMVDRTKKVPLVIHMADEGVRTHASDVGTHELMKALGVNKVIVGVPFKRRDWCAEGIQSRTEAMKGFEKLMRVLGTCNEAWVFPMFEDSVQLLRHALDRGPEAWPQDCKLLVPVEQPVSV